MRRLLLGQLRHRRARLAALGLAILVAAASFTLLTASANTSAVHVRQTLKRNFRGAYDILVRPRGSFTPIEKRRGLVRDNYLSGIYGGITFKQYHEIERIPGVAVAAPIANVGTVLVEERLVVSLRRFLGSQADQLFRVRFSWVAQDGLSHYPGSEEYLYATRRRLDVGPLNSIAARDPLTGEPDECEGYDASRPLVRSPFVPVNSSTLSCASPNLTQALRHLITPGPLVLPPVVRFSFELPLNVSAVDPEAEAKLVGLRRAMVSGSYLSSSARPRLYKFWREIPALAASRSFVDERLQVRIERLVVPAGTDVPGMVGAGGCGGNDFPDWSNCHTFGPPPQHSLPHEPGPPGHRHITAYRWLTGLRGIPIDARSFDAQRLYAQRLRRRNSFEFPQFQIVHAYWRGAPVRYRRLADSTLEPLPVKNGAEVWQDPVASLASGYLDQPTDNRDVQFRKIADTHAGLGTVLDNNEELRVPALRVVGVFDPSRLRGFSALSRVPLETYYPPSLEPGDASSRKLLHGRPLLPSQNIGDYEQQPPLLLTNLRGLQTLLSAGRFTGLSPRQQHAPISVIRVRVKGVTGPNGLSEARIRTVALLIHQRTGLDLDITAGSSPTPITIRLPKGRYGRPALTLKEGWVQKGTSVRYLRALDRKDLALFALILVVCAFFLGNGAFASVRARRSELGALATLGWSPAETFRIVLAELAVVGLAAGIAGTGLAAGLVRGLGLDFPLLRTMLVLPIAVALALVAGLLPAWLAARGKPLDAVRPPVSAGGHGRRTRTIAAMAFADLARLPIRTLVGAAGLALGIAALTVILAIERSFHGVLVSTVLGNFLSVQVRRADFVALGLTLALAALSAADVLYLNVRERQAELVTLATLGWSDGEIRRLLSLEALYLALTAGLSGAVVGVLVGAFVLDVSAAPLAVAAVIVAAGAAGVALLASLLPLLRLRGLAAPEVLAAE